jgi:hypothetical protein
MAHVPLGVDFWLRVNDRAEIKGSIFRGDQSRKTKTRLDMIMETRNLIKELRQYYFAKWVRPYIKFEAVTEIDETKVGS